jgi:acyl dehydratase
MTLRRDPGADRRLYLEDLQVGQRLVSGSHAIDKEQIKAFAAQFDPQVFHLDDEAAKTTLILNKRDRSNLIALKEAPYPNLEPLASGKEPFVASRGGAL